VNGDSSGHGWGRNAIGVGPVTRTAGILADYASLTAGSKVMSSLATDFKTYVLNLIFY